MEELREIYNNKKVLITGHTGFKGSWLVIVLQKLGAKVSGYALDPPTNPSLFKNAVLGQSVHSYQGDIRDYSRLAGVISDVRPEIIFHLAAQAIVRESFSTPVDTYSTNVMGTVHVLEACRHTDYIRAVVNVATDKCYENKEWYWGYREEEQLGGYDPYSSSKGCSELVTASFRNSYFNREDYDRHRLAIASARAGNVIGGGDFAADRLVPDFIRAISQGQKLHIRNPRAIRPWQHVLEPLSGYLQLGGYLLTEGPKYAEAWNFGPDDNDARDVEWIASQLCEYWGQKATYQLDLGDHPHEATYLKLDCSKAKSKLSWRPRWNVEASLRSIVEWNKSWMKGTSSRMLCEERIEKYFAA